MAFENLKMKLTGVAPLLMHNGQLADPTNKHAKAMKEISSRRKKTEADFLELKRAEWFGGLYLDESNQIAIPADLVLAIVIGGAKKNKNGSEAKAGIYEAQPFFKLEYDGAKDINKLFDDERFVDYRGVKVGQSRVMRTRPIFKKWSTTVEVMIDEEIIDTKQVVQAFIAAGERVGLGDFRPRFGRFIAEKVK